MAPRVKSAIAVPARKSHAVAVLDVGDRVGGPVEASAVRGVGAIDGASATGAGVLVGAAGGAVIGATGGLLAAAGGRDMAGEPQT